MIKGSYWLDSLSRTLTLLFYYYDTHNGNGATKQKLEPVLDRIYLYFVCVYFVARVSLARLVLVVVVNLSRWPAKAKLLK